MKTNQQATPLLFKIILLITCFMMALLYNQSMAAEVPTASHSSARVAAVNFKQDTEKNELTITVKTNSATTMQLFIFSADGILINEVAVSANKTTTTKGLQKGFYVYECFDKDKRMKTGNLIIKKSKK